jgi:hypothetical protein
VPPYECGEIAVSLATLRSQHPGRTASGYFYLVTSMVSLELAPCWHGAVMVTRKFASWQARNGGSLPCDSAAPHATSGARCSAQCIPQTVGALASILDRGLGSIGECNAALTSWSHGWLGGAVLTLAALAFTAAAFVASALRGSMGLPVTFSRNGGEELPPPTYKRLQHSPAPAFFPTSHLPSPPLLRRTLRLRGAGDEDSQPVPAAMDTQLPRAGEPSVKGLVVNVVGGSVATIFRPRRSVPVPRDHEGCMDPT